jgi:hypothetical protein
LIRWINVENPLWGAPRIRAELLKLGFEIAQSSVAEYIVKQRGWRTFLRNHEPDIAAMDLCVVLTIGFGAPDRGYADRDAPAGVRPEQNEPFAYRQGSRNHPHDISGDSASGRRHPGHFRQLLDPSPRLQAKIDGFLRSIAAAAKLRSPSEARSQRALRAFADRRSYPPDGKREHRLAIPSPSLWNAG